MNLSDDCHLAYVVSGEAWYAATSVIPFHDRGVSAELNVCAASNGGGVEWEFSVTEHPDINRGSVQLHLFDDAFAAFEQIPELFLALARQQPTTLAHVRRILDVLGARDETARISPYAEDRGQ